MTSDAYKRAGVDIDTAGRLVESIKALATTTRRPGMHGDIGGFGALFDLAAAGYRDPILVASTDGVGTKLKVAFAADVHDTIGIDLVAMSVNDLVVQGAEPLFFLDYFATGGLDAGRAAQVIAGIAAGCRDARCGLIGGETAEMPGMYAKGEYDLAGFAVGAVERSGIVDGRSVCAGDVVLGLASSGVHSNGYSLVRRIVADAALDYGMPAPFAPGRNLAQGLLVPTRIYVQSCLAAIRAGGVKALAHITGGGLLENVPRVIPDGLATEIDAKRWPLLSVFDWLARTGKLTARDLARTFNCGIGMVAVAAPENAGAVAAAFRAGGETVYEIGRIVPLRGDEAVRIVNAETAWPVARA